MLTSGPSSNDDYLGHFKKTMITYLLTYLLTLNVPIATLRSHFWEPPIATPGDFHITLLFCCYSPPQPLFGNLLPPCEIRTKVPNEQPIREMYIH